MIGIVGFVLAVQMVAAPPNCGADVYHKAIVRTETLIEQAVSVRYLDPEPSDLVSGGICVRVQFSLSSEGRAKEIKVAEGYYSRAFNVAVLEALRKFVFNVPKAHDENKFMLVFRREADGSVELVPPRRR